MENGTTGCQAFHLNSKLSSKQAITSMKAREC